jgi:hypothetical protein
MSRPFLALSLAIGISALVGCSFTSSVQVSVPHVGQSASIVPIASMRTLGSGLLGVDEAALTSRAALTRLDDQATCVDMVLRHPSTPVRPTMVLSVEVDGEDALAFDPSFDDCKSGACLPPGSPLEAFTAETDDRVAVEATQMCFEKLPRARRELSVGRRGVFAWRFRFLLDGSDG